MNTKPALFSLMRSGILAFACLYSTSEIANAQVTSDGTVNTQVNQSGNVSEITGGETRGNNLFHSFQEFSIRTGNEAFFNNADAIKNIFSRVTGGNASSIDGLIRANGSASLFLINPAGIIFGEGARLDIDGSFYGSSADSILFEDGKFSATDLDNPPVLTVNAPIGLGFRDNPADIANSSVANDGNGLEVAPENNLTLLGGDVSFNGGAITAPAGRVELGGLSAVGTISFNNDGSLSFPDGVGRGNVSLTNEAFVGVAGDRGGNIAIDANDLTMSGNSELEGGTPSTGIADGQSGDIILNATGKVAIDASTIDNEVGIGNAGEIKISATNFSLVNDGQINNSTSGKGNAGNVTINTIDDVSLDTGRISSNVKEEGEGNAGNIFVDTENLSLTNGAKLSSSTFSKGNADNITINATKDVSLDTGGIFSNVGSKDVSQAEGNAGEITIDANSISLTNGAQIQSGVFEGGLGNGNNVTLNARDGDVTIFGSNQGKSGIFTDIETNADYNAGNIKIDAPQGSILLDNAVIKNTTVGTGFAGDIELNALNEIFIKNSEILAEGNFGRIFIGNSIQPSQVTLEGERTTTEDGSDFSNQLSTTSLNSDDFVGSISINARDSINVIGSGIDSRTYTTRTTDIDNQDGLNYGTVKLKVGEQNPAGTITLNQSKISTTNFDTGYAGDVILNAREKIAVLDTSIFSRGQLGQILIGKSNLSGETLSPQEVSFNNSFLTVSNDSVTTASETKDQQIDAGDISINAVNNISFINSSQINAFTQRIGGGGDLTVQSENGTVSFDNSDVFSNVNPGGIGDAGDINITANSIFLTNGAQLQSGIVETSDDSTQSGRGNGGNVTLNAEKNITLSGSNQDNKVSGIFADVEETATGDGGNIDITTGSLSLTDQAILTAESLGFGNAGIITVNAESITLDNNSSIKASNTPPPDFSANLEGGNVDNIDLNIADRLILRNNSTISAEAASNASGGNIDIDAGFVIAFPSSDNDIRANAQQGQGGNINITAQGVFGIEERPLNDSTNDINASSESNLDGTVSITILEPDTIQGTAQLPINVIEPQQTSEQACSVNQETGEANGLTVKGKGGVPPAPDLPLNSQVITVNGQDTTTQTNQAQYQEIKPIPTSYGDIIPAQGLIVTEDGRAILTAYRTDGNSRVPQGYANCGR